MMEINIKILAEEMNISIEDLVKKCISAGILKQEYNYINDHEKKILDKYLKSTSTILKNTLTLKRKTRSTLNISNVGGKNKYVQVEIRKKKTYIKPQQEFKHDIFKKINFFSKKNNDNTLLTTGKKDDSTIHSHKSSTKNSSILNNLKLNLKSNDIRRKINNFSRNAVNKNHFSKTVISKHAPDIKRSTFENKKTNKEQKRNQIQSIINYDKYHVANMIRSSYSHSNNDSIEIKSKSNNKHTKRLRHKKKIYRVDLKNSTDIEHNNRSYPSSILRQVFQKPSCIINRDIIINNAMTVSELANKMAVKCSELIKIMMKLGYAVTINQNLDQDIAQLVAEEMGHKVTIHQDDSLEQKIMRNRNVSNTVLKIRPPIVTVMGHVDHGKTSLLDYIKLTKIASQEAGGITQHIGAYCIEIERKIITFLDTPGHAAFTAMRARGAKITDIVILVIAADDGVKPQTIEAIQHAQAASVPIIVAINKIDKLNSEPDKIKNELTKYNIVPEEWGGNNIFVHISAKTGQGINHLLKSILVQAEMLELKASSSGMATGLVIESFLDKGQGPIATILIQEGVLNKGDVVLCGLEYGKIRAIKNSLEQEIEFAGPSIPVKVLGLSGIPISGDTIIVVRNEKEARAVSLHRQEKFREKKLSKKTIYNVSNIFEKVKKDNELELNIVLKSDVQGSLEAISDALHSLSNNNVKIKIIGKGVGNITETDVSLAIASKAMIIGFNVKSDLSVKQMVFKENVDLRYYSVIYHIIDEIKNSIYGMTIPKYKQEIVGLAEVRNVFKSPKFGSIAGCMVIEGIVKRNDCVRILRQNKAIYTGELESLRRFKEDVHEVRNGVECGIGIKNYNDICINDLIEAFQKLKIK
ncbi:MAG: translation initiation factor IF-2 [Buchnera aphidicola (Kaburagia rhusicola ensigallis)]